MEPAEFEGQNACFGADQPEYRPLPAHKAADGTVTSCWSLTWAERLKVLLTGRVWLRQMTFNQGLQPQLPSALKPELE